MDKIANNLLDNIHQYGPDTNTFFSVIPAMSPVSFSGGARFAHLIGGVVCSFYDWYCDLPPGQPITWGVQTEACECADWFNAKYIVLWGSNINETRIPDAHFAWEAKYNGAKVACISPDYNSSSIHTDQYLRINPGTDAVLALAVCRYLIENNLHHEDYVKEQTDLPFLVREDNQQFLRASDLGIESEKPEETFFIWDAKTDAPVAVPGAKGHAEQTLDLGELDPALRGTRNVTLSDGSQCAVRPVFERLVDSLSDDVYSIEGASERCGIPVADLEVFFKDWGERHPAMIIHGAGTNHWYHNDLINRAMILVVALTGNVGINGGGFNHYVGQERIWPEHGFKKLTFPQGGKKQRFQNTTLWVFCHSTQHDPHLVAGQPPEYWILEAVREGWMPIWPKNDWDSLTPEQMHDLPRKPRALIVWRANFLNQAKGNEAILKSLWKDLDLIVNINYRMDTTALYSDIVLPAASYYEKTDINSTDCHTYIHPFGKVLDPLYESKTDWDVFKALVKKVQEVAVARGLAEYNDEDLDWERDFSTLYADWTANGELETDEQACNFILANSAETKGMTYHSIQEQPQRFVGIDHDAWTGEIEDERAYTPFTDHTERKIPWRTLTGRQQFYIDHPWYVKFGEELPVHMEPQDDPDYPLYWNTPHGRWSIHSTWRDNRYMLRLQRGIPVVYISAEEAIARNIADNDWVRIYNGEGEAVVKCKIRPGEKIGRITMYHGWEKYMGFQKGSWQSLTYVKVKPTQLVGYGHLKFKLNYWGPTGNNRDIKVEIEKYTGPTFEFEESQAT